MAETRKEPAMRYLSERERLGSRGLWEEAFPEDSRQFMDYYFAEKIKDNQVLALAENGRIEAMIHLNPYLLQVKDRQWQVDYLVGVATRIDRRHQGYMRRLLMRMMADMRAEKMPFCFLMPADEAIYRPFGFTFVFDQPQFGWKTDVEKFKKIPVQTAKQIDAAVEWINKWLMERYEVYAVRDKDYVERLVKEIASEGGSLERVMDAGRMIGLRSFWGLEKRIQRMLYADNTYVTEVREPKPAIMARIIDVERFVSVIGLRPRVEKTEVILVVRLEDPLIPDNDGVWKWTLRHAGSELVRLSETSEGVQTAEYPETVADGARAKQIALTITELTFWLFGYGIPESAAGLGDVVQPLQGIFLDEVV